MIAGVLQSVSNIMNKKMQLLMGVAVVLVIVSGFFLMNSKNSIVSDDILPSVTATPDKSHADLILVTEPVSGQKVSSPLEITGKARGYWFFEASFPVRILDANGVELGVVPAQAQPDPATGEINWMTEDFVPFKAVLEFRNSSTETGTLVLEKDNPSGLPENDDQISIPVRFDPGLPKTDIVEKKGNCKVAGCSGQLCIEESAEDLVTTCEFKEEYACYKTAKCEKQADGHCGWTPSEELVACLYQAWQKEGTPE